MRQHSIITSILLFMLIFSSCKDKSESMSNEEKIAGQDSKTWVATRETNSEGEKDKLTKAEKKETITFWKNGNVKMGDGAQDISGQWSYNSNTLALQFDGSEVSENFTVLELDDEKIKLKAMDGSEMTLEPQ